MPPNPAPALPVQKKKSGCLKIGLIGVGVLLLLGVIINLFSDPPPPAEPVDPNVTLEQAEANILTSVNGTAYSNTEAGQKLAEVFSAEFKEAAQSGTDYLKDHHDFITHCQLNDESALFLVHVPKLRKFDKESKEQFCQIAWLIAHSALQSSELPVGSALAVGVKGNVLYQNIYLGKYNPANLEATDHGVEQKTKESSVLDSYFNQTATTETK